ncbi:hypothetical protein POV27_02560 [Aureisphaera galaxeae]|uniref:hypothetical protein n=1 Tax=Aureisphaera galaxeae TaxID=1538023 RepID=UPI002350B92B|nr:hypothetical protein [Aureisphaera galaxeae]MDC8002924.1 hypothetical protein [Aureisphaera galaxeae]
MKPGHIKEQRAKELRRIRKRQREIWKERRELGYIKLEKPIRHGWFKELVLTPRLDRYKHKNEILEIYGKLTKKFWGRTKGETDKKWSQTTSKYFFYKEIPTISMWQYVRLSEDAQLLCVPFRYYTEKKRLRIRFYINIPKGVYKIKYTRAYITHTKRIDPALESEMALLYQQELKSGYYELDKKGYKYYNDWKYWEALDEKSRTLKAKTALRGLKDYSIQELVNEEISWERN